MHYIKFGNSIKPLIAFLLFYGLRGIIQTFFLLDYYPIYLFTYPGFTSLSVPSSRAADFFYSGHTGCAFLITLNFKEMGEPVPLAKSAVKEFGDRGNFRIRMSDDLQKILVLTTEKSTTKNTLIHNQFFTERKLN